MEKRNRLPNSTTKRDENKHHANMWQTAESILSYSQAFHPKALNSRNLAGLLASLDVWAFSCTQTDTMALGHKSLIGVHPIGVTVAGTAPAFYRIPF